VTVLRDAAIAARGAVTAVVVTATVAGCASVASPAAVFRGCDAYRDQQTAQRAWERGGKPAGADGDSDGRVCEALGHGRAERRACRRVAGVVVVRIPRRRYPYTADHILDAIAAGEPQILHVDRAGADANREQSLRGIPTRPGYDRDEYPPAVSREGGADADVRYVPSSDNRGAGTVMGERLHTYCDGQRFRLRMSWREQQQP
jgi:Deoxyribonuclease NucA/NucB